MNEKLNRTRLVQKVKEMEYALRSETFNRTMLTQKMKEM